MELIDYIKIHVRVDKENNKRCYHEYIETSGKNE